MITREFGTTPASLRKPGYTFFRPVCSVLSSTVVNPGPHMRGMRKKNSFHQRCLRRILHIKWQDKISNTEVLERANMRSIYTILCERRLHWLGHVKRMDPGRILKDLLYGELAEGSRHAGRPKLRFKDVCKRDMK